MTKQKEPCDCRVMECKEMHGKLPDGMFCVAEEVPAQQPPAGETK